LRISPRASSSIMMPSTAARRIAPQSRSMRSLSPATAPCAARRHLRGTLAARSTCPGRRCCRRHRAPAAGRGTRLRHEGLLRRNRPWRSASARHRQRTSIR
jgi:hypothetical protein